MANNNSPDNESVYNTRTIFSCIPIRQSTNNPPQDLFSVFQYVNPPPNTPPEFLFPPVTNPPANNPPQNPRPNAEVQYEQDMQELLRAEAEEEDERRAREEYLRAKQARRNARCAWRIRNGLDRVPTSEDDSSASSNEGYVSDDSFY